MNRSASEPHWLGRVDRWAATHGWAADGLLALACAAVLVVVVAPWCAAGSRSAPRWPAW